MVNHDICLQQHARLQWQVLALGRYGLTVEVGGHLVEGLAQVQRRR